MTVYRTDPLQDARWLELVWRHPQASIFHTPGWLDALHQTYGYKPIAYTTTGPGSTQLNNGLAFCEITSWLTGDRLVSLPFSDHCEPLMSSTKEFNSLLEFLKTDLRNKKWKYVELRPLSQKLAESGPHFANSATFGFHKIDLRPETETIYRRFHDSCVRRKIRKAEREQLKYESGRSEALLHKFHYLLLLTRRRHKLPPQPFAWFKNLIRCLSDQVTFHVVSRGADPIASIVTLYYKKTLTYKYGCSDARFHNLGGTSLLFWKAIQQGKELGAIEFDLGRSAPEDAGLSVFKGHLGAAQSELHYYRYPVAPIRSASRPRVAFVRQAFARMPRVVFTGTGRLLYRHLG